MAGPAKQIMGEVVRPRFNCYTIIDHALGSYELGEDGLYYNNGGFAHIMAITGRGNVFKTMLLDYLIMTILLRYSAEWASKYDTEVSAQLERLDTAIYSVFLANGWDYNPETDNVLRMILELGNYNLCSSDSLPGEDWWSQYIRDEVEARFKQYAKGQNLRVTPFLDPIRKKLKAIINPWLYSVDSMSEFHTSAIEAARDKSDIGTSDQNALAAQDPKQKADMMSRWPTALARGGMYLGFTGHLNDGLTMGKQDANTGKLLDDFKGDVKVAGVPKRALTFLVNAFLCATSSGELKQPQTYNSKTGTNDPMFPTFRNKSMASSVNDLKIIRYTQFRAKGGPTGVKFDLIFSQEEGFKAGLSLWYYLKEVLTNDYGFTRSGHFYALDILPETKFGRTTIRDMVEDDKRLLRALQITAGLAYYTNNNHRLPCKYRLTPAELYEKIIEQGYDWNEIIDNTVEYWMFMDQIDKKSKKTITVRTLLGMAFDECKPKFLTRKKPA